MDSMCKKCQQSAQDIFEDASTRVTSASCPLIRCGVCVCVNYQTLWSVSGQFGQSQMEIAVVLGSRMIGIGYESLKMYHAILDLPAPPNKPKFEKIPRDMIIVAETTARESG